MSLVGCSGGGFVYKPVLPLELMKMLDRDGSSVMPSLKKSLALQLRQHEGEETGMSKGFAAEVHEILSQHRHH